MLSGSGRSIASAQSGQSAMYDPIPWHIDEIEAHRRGLEQAGWYMMAFDGKPVVGPHDDPEACVMAIRDLVPKPH